VNARRASAQSRDTAVAESRDWRRHNLDRIQAQGERQPTACPDAEALGETAQSLTYPLTWGSER